MYKKPIVGEGQMQIDYNSVDPVQNELITEPITESIPEEIEQESSLTRLLRAYGKTEKELEDYAEKRGCSFNEAYRRFGISETEVDNMAVDYPIEVSPEATEDEVSIPEGPSVSIAKRAIYLIAALERYSKASQVSGLNKALDTAHAGDLYRRYDENALVQMIASRGPRTREGDAEFSKAYGRKEMIEAGEKPSKVGFDERTQTDKFIYNYVGADNPDNRRIYRSVLKKQIKKFKKP